MGMEMEELVRVRVVFDDRDLLSNSQRLEGMKRSWILLKPGMVTISDIASLLRTRFNLKCSCPDGLLLFMDNFVLPPFESTCLLKDNDTIRVRRKDVPLVDVIDAGNDRHCIEDSVVMEGQLMHSSQELLAITEFQEDSGLCRSRKEKHSSPCNEQTIETKSASSQKTKSRRKRKHSENALDPKGDKLKLSNAEILTDNTELDENIHSGQTGGSSLREKHSNGDGRSNALIISQVESTAQKMHSHGPKEVKRKKSKVNRPEKSIVAAENADKIEPNQSCYEKGESSQKNLQRKHKMSTKDGSSIMPIGCVLDCRISKLPSSVPKEERKDKPKENNVCDPHANCSSKKVQSRNARRKKATRQWLREIIRSQNNKDIQSDHLLNDTHKNSTERQEKFLTSETEEDIVPFVVRPGHIRFEPLGAEQSLCPSQEAMICETVQGNGTTNKEEGQKWGRKNNYNKYANSYKEHSNRNSDAVGWRSSGKSIAEGWKSNEKSNAGSCSGKSIAEGLGKDSAGGWKSNEKTSSDGWPTNGKSIAEGLGRDSAGGWKSNGKPISDGWPTNGKSIAEGLEKDSAGGWKSNEKPICHGWPTNGKSIAQGLGKDSAGGWKSNEKPISDGWPTNGKYIAKGLGKDSAGGWKSNEKAISHGWPTNGKSIAGGLRKDSAGGWKSNEKPISHGWPTNGKSIAQGLGKDSAGGWESNENPISHGWPTNGKSAAGMKSKEKFILQEGKTGDCCIDFESLFPLTRLPQKGDLLVYKLFELSSSWRPEVSSFRVGKVSSYDPISMRIILAPVPEYPIFCREDVDGEESVGQVKASAYKEDGSLEVHYPSLVDVRLLKANSGEASIAEHGGREMVTVEATPANNWEKALAKENGKVIGTLSVMTPTGGQSVWGQIKLAISEKKAQVQKNNGWEEWSNSRTTATTSWSHRALTGPTPAFLRGKNGKSGYKK